VPGARAGLRIRNRDSTIDPGQRFVAVLCIALAIAIWVTELEVTHDVIGHGPGQYDNAYALVWMSHNVSLFLGFGLGAVFACFAEVRSINAYKPLMN
jgi:hypothetical protein